MTGTQVHQRRSAFAWWLRTGRLPPVRTADGVELKFNPYHDPRNGRFTFAPAGVSGAVDLDGHARRTRAAGLASGPTEPMRRGGNARAFEDPMTLEQVVPALRGGPAGEMFAIADNIFDFTGPANELQASLLDDWSERVILDIKAVDPNWHEQTVGAPTTIEGRTSRLNYLRFERAAALLRVKGEIAPLQVEVTRLMQERTNEFYEEAVAQLKAGRLVPRLSPAEAVGNYVDSRVRNNLRFYLGRAGLGSASTGPVRVNRREDDTSGADRTFRRPDARVGDVAFDVTLTRKTLSTPQVRGFFATDFKPSRVVIIRPSQLGTGHSYIITRPRAKR